MSVRHVPIEEMEVFKRFVALADWAWEAVSRWPPFASDTIGKQLVRDIDPVGATLVEGDGRYSDREAAHLFILARGSARETRFWLQRAITRRLLASSEGEARIGELIVATRMLNSLIKYRRSQQKNGRVREGEMSYDAGNEDPFTDTW
jgi:four helix bundle protein